MDRLQILVLVWILVSSTAAFYIYEPNGVIVNQPPKQYTLADYITRGFSFDGKEGGAENAILAIPTMTITKRPAPKYLRRRKPTPVKRTNNYQILSGSTPKQTESAAINEDPEDFSYFSAMQFGSKGESLYMLLDTGSSDTWVMGTTCKSTACGTHNTFGPSDSTTLKVTTEAFSDAYGTGNVSGVIATDNVELAGLKVPLTFGIASSVSDHFDNYPMDGLLALGRPSQSTLNAPTFMEAIASAKLLPANIFGINLQRHQDGTTDGEINFGAPDTSKYTGSLAYMDVVNNQNWEIPVDDALVGGVSVKLTGNTAIIDTGTSQVFIPPKQAQALFAAIPGSVQVDSETFHIPCDTTTSIEFVFGKVAFSISPEDYIGGGVSGNMCASNIFGVQVAGSNQWLLGDVFLKNVYSVFDTDKERIGFGAKTATPITAGAMSQSVTESGAGPTGTISDGSAATDSPIMPATKTSPSEQTKPTGTSLATGVSQAPSVTISGGRTATGTSAAGPELGSASTISSSPKLWALLFLIPSLWVTVF